MSMKSSESSVYCIKSLIPHYAGSIGIITGSGWDPGNVLDNVTEIEYKEITGFPIPSVGGHKGRLIHGFLHGKEIIILQGRIHYYEGYDIEEVTFPVRVLSGLGIKQIIITNAAGGIRPDLNPGDFMLVTDHLNLMGVNPLRCGEGMRMGSPGETTSGEIFVDMTEAYNRQLCNTALSAAKKNDIPLSTGILAAVSGPSYETPAEIRMLRSIGADAVCMSTVPEVIMSRKLGIQVLAVSMITNHAAGIRSSELRHQDVVSMAGSRSKEASRLISAIIDHMPR